MWLGLLVQALDDILYSRNRRTDMLVVLFSVRVGGVGTASKHDAGLSATAP